ncbi:hypothetical protein [Streptomyces hayashii]|uniref:hypothetical protein n=1 Tax=Streptomyces hayashii TaxID=2839966 RepID=UPI00403D504F
MTGIEELLSRALLVRERTVPRDVVSHPTPPAAATRTTAEPAPGSHHSAAAQDLRALCETLILHTPAAAVAQFVTDQVPEPRSALVLACVLQLTDTDEGARFWWQYAAGGGQAAAAYCLYLHHLSLGEREAADWWHRQTGEVQSCPPLPAQDEDRSWNPAEHQITNATTIHCMRILRHLAQQTVRSRPAALGKLMAYIPAAVTAGYLREPDTELPLPGDEFARRIASLLATTDRAHTWDRQPNQPAPHPRDATDAETVERGYLQPIPEQMGTAQR